MNEGDNLYIILCKLLKNAQKRTNTKSFLFLLNNLHYLW